MLPRHCTLLISAFLYLVFGITSVAAAGTISPLRTPAPGPKPHINGPTIYGVRPGKPFLYRIPCTGVRPIHFSADHLPSSLQLDTSTGIITGTAPQARGAYTVRLVAENAHGRSERKFSIEVGDRIGLTPQMGWNDWYSYYDRISQADVRASAAAMVASGMADYGYQYVSIDDTWARKPGSADPALTGPVRDASGSILPNRRFPDMAGLVRYIHGLGLKAGIYTSPGPLTCAGYEGAYGHESQDARQFAAWGFDLLKYDWCSYGKVATGQGTSRYETPYRLMGNILDGLDRDVIFNLCEYGKADVWTWGRQVGGNSWRTTDDLGLAQGRTLPGFYSIGMSNANHRQYAGPGGWNDPDYILIGVVGDAHHGDAPAQPTRLTPAEQYSYMSMWSLMSAPLFFSGEVTKLDRMTLNVLCNSEVIDIDQDSLGTQARIVRETPEEFVLEKPLSDGSVAVGLFNLRNSAQEVSVEWPELGLTGRQQVRDVWRQKNLRPVRERYAIKLAAHDVMLIKLTGERGSDSPSR